MTLSRQQVIQWARDNLPHWPTQYPPDTSHRGWSWLSTLHYGYVLINTDETDMVREDEVGMSEIKIVTDSDGNQWVVKCDGEVTIGLFELSTAEEIKDKFDLCRQRVDEFNTEKRELNKVICRQQFYIKCWQALSSVIAGLSITFIFGA